MVTWDMGQVLSLVMCPPPRLPAGTQVRSTGILCGSSLHPSGTAASTIRLEGSAPRLAPAASFLQHEEELFRTTVESPHGTLLARLGWPPRRFALSHLAPHQQDLFVMLR